MVKPNVLVTIGRFLLVPRIGHFNMVQSCTTDVTDHFDIELNSFKVIFSVMHIVCSAKCLTKTDHKFRSVCGTKDHNIGFGCIKGFPLTLQISNVL